MPADNRNNNVIPCRPESTTAKRPHWIPPRKRVPRTAAAGPCADTAW